MTRNTARILEDAMSLSISDRATVAYRLLSSLQSEPTEGVPTVWRDEIKKRARVAMSDDWQGDSWEAVRERVKPSE